LENIIPFQNSKPSPLSRVADPLLRNGYILSQKSICVG